MIRHHNQRRGFTLMEILIVVIILGILAAIVIPQFTNASATARDVNISNQLHTVRGQLELFTSEHNDISPQITSGLWTIMLTGSSTDDTNTLTPTGNAWGPYLQAAPYNPLAQSSSVTNAPAAGYGWWYQANARGDFTFRALDSTGSVLSY